MTTNQLYLHQLTNRYELSSSFESNRKKIVDMKILVKPSIRIILILNLIALASVKSYGQLSPSFGKITHLQFSDLDFKMTLALDSKKIILYSFRNTTPP